MADTDVLLLWAGSGVSRGEQVQLGDTGASSPSDAVLPERYTDALNLISGSLLSGVTVEAASVYYGQSYGGSAGGLVSDVPIRAYIASGVLYIQIWDSRTDALVQVAALTISAITSKVYKNYEGYADATNVSQADVHWFFCLSIDPTGLPGSGDATATYRVTYEGPSNYSFPKSMTRAVSPYVLGVGSNAQSGAWALRNILALGGLWHVMSYGARYADPANSPLFANESGSVTIDTTNQKLVLSLSFYSASTGTLTYTADVSYATAWTGYAFVGAPDRSFGALFRVDTSLIRKILTDSTYNNQSRSFYLYKADAWNTIPITIRDVTLKYRYMALYLWNRTASTQSLSYDKLSGLTGGALNITYDEMLVEEIPTVSLTEGEYRSIAPDEYVPVSIGMWFGGTQPAMNATGQIVATFNF